MDEKLREIVTESLRRSVEVHERKRQEIQAIGDFQDRSELKGLRTVGLPQAAWKPQGYYKLHCQHDRLIFIPCSKCGRNTELARANVMKYSTMKA